MNRFWAASVTALCGIFGAFIFGARLSAAIAPMETAGLAFWDNGIQRSAAEAALKSNLPTKASQFGIAAVRAMPFDQFALASSTIAQTDTRRLTGLNIVAALGWRDPASNIALIEAGLAQDQIEIAAARIDALGRTQGADVAARYANRILEHPSGAEAMAERAELRAKSAWWEAWLRSASKSRDQALHRIEMIKHFTADDGPWLRQSVGDAAVGFGKSAFDDLSIDLWRATLVDEQDFHGPLYDNEFREFDPSRSAIGGEWHIARSAPATFERIEQGGLKVELLGDGGGALLSQKLKLEPARYQFSAAGSDRSKLLSFRLSCDQRVLLPASAEVNESGHIASYTFDVSSDCGLVTLTIFANPDIRTVAQSAFIAKLEMAQIR